MAISSDDNLNQDEEVGVRHESCHMILMSVFFLGKFENLFFLRKLCSVSS